MGSSQQRTVRKEMRTSCRNLDAVSGNGSMSDSSGPVVTPYTTEDSRRARPSRSVVNCSSDLPLSGARVWMSKTKFEKRIQTEKQKATTIRNGWWSALSVGPFICSRVPPNHRAGRVQSGGALRIRQQNNQPTNQSTNEPSLEALPFEAIDWTAARPIIPSIYIDCAPITPQLSSNQPVTDRENELFPNNEAMMSPAGVARSREQTNWGLIP